MRQPGYLDPYAPIAPERERKSAVRHEGNRVSSRVHGSFVIGERGRETTVDVRQSTEQIKAQLLAYSADRRRRGISPGGILFEGEEA